MRKEISIDLPIDSDGFLPRECPHCEGKFKINVDDFQKGKFLNLRCPYCRFIERYDHYTTEEQVAYSEAVSQNELRRMAEEELSEALDGLFDSVKSNDFISVSGSSEIDFGEVTATSPHLSIETVATACDKCGFTFAVSTKQDPNTTFCPVCRDM